MKIKSLKLKNYRNYDLLDLEFDRHINLFYGDNAQGKTNILEAVYLSGTTKSHRGTKDRDMIQFGKNESHIETVVEKEGKVYRIDIHLKKNQAKGVAVNKMPIHKASELFGIINFVFFSPEDLNIIKNGPAQRRRFLDLELSQIDKLYLNNLVNYHRIVNQRNYLLKELYFSYDKKLAETLDIWDGQLIAYGKKIMERRKEFVYNVNKIVSMIHKKLTGDQEELRIDYEPGSQGLPLEQAVEKNREKDIRAKTTSVGPHRDDLCFLSGGIDLRRFGSQGQQRTAALSLKLSEIALVEEMTQQKPVLLLDDVLSELDKHRQNYLLESIGDIQTLITCTGMEDFMNHRIAVDQVFHVEAGRVEKEGTCC